MTKVMTKKQIKKIARRKDYEKKKNINRNRPMFVKLMVGENEDESKNKNYILKRRLQDSDGGIARQYPKSRKFKASASERQKQREAKEDKRLNKLMPRQTATGK